MWGISSALLGEITFRGGTAQQATYADYGVARMRDTPAIEVHIVPSDATEPFGMSEPAVPPVGARDRERDFRRYRQTYPAAAPFGRTI